MLSVRFENPDDSKESAINNDEVSDPMTEKQDSVYPTYCCSPLKSNCPTFKKTYGQI
jgi:hypothetical protein